MISRNEIGRKSIHFANALIPLGYLGLPLEHYQVLAILGFGLAVSLTLDITRMRKGPVREAFNRYFEWMLREKEIKGTLTGATWVMIAAFVIIAVFPKPIAVLSLLFMSFGDSFAALTGIAIGKVTLIGNKTLEGSIACFTACLLAGTFFPGIDPITRFTGAFAATLVEVLPLKLDDNFSIPFFSALVMTGVGLMV